MTNDELEAHKSLMRERDLAITSWLSEFDGTAVKADVWDEGLLAGYKLGSGASTGAVNPYRTAS